MSLLVNALKHAIDEVARAKQLTGYRVLDKVNARGEVVIALILPRDGGTLPPLTREERKERQRR